MKILITLSLITSLLTPSFGQYTNQLDTLSRKEIKQLILNQDESQKAKNLMSIHEGLKYISYISYSFGGISLLSRIHTKNEIDQLLTVSVGAAFVATGLILTAISRKNYSKSVNVYKQSLPSAPTHGYIRDAQPIYHTGIINKQTTLRR